MFNLAQTPSVEPRRGEATVRRVHWLAATCILMGVDGWANAQQRPSSFFTGVTAQEIRNVPLDTSKAITQQPGQSARFTNRFDFSALFSRKSGTLYTPK